MIDMTIPKLLMGLFGFCAAICLITYAGSECRCEICTHYRKKATEIEFCDEEMTVKGGKRILCGEKKPCPWHGGAQ